MTEIVINNTDEQEHDKQVATRIILITEDDETNFLYLKTVLELKGMNVLRARNGEEAIDMCRQHPEISLILMDIKMKGMNGLEATRQIKKFNPTIPIIAQTAYALRNDKNNAIAAGCDDYIAKPINRALLLKKINLYIKTS